MDVKKAGWKSVFRFFTVLSNVLCAIMALLVVICRVQGYLNPYVFVGKYVGTVAVMVTFLTVMLFLGPTQKNYKVLLSGPELHLHFTVPLISLVSFLLWDKTEMPATCIFLGVLPVLLYGILYLKKVVFSEGENKWDDFYGFNLGGRWKISFTAMVVATFILSCALYFGAMIVG